MKTAGKVVAGTTAGAVILLGGYGGLAALRADTIPAGTTIDGTPVGGLSLAEATTKVQTASKQTLAKPITISTDAGNLQIVPADSGISLDTGAALTDLTGFTLSPAEVFQRYTGGGPKRTVHPVIDLAALQQAVAAAGEKIKGAAVNPTVKFVQGAVQVTDGKPGTGVDAAAVARQIAAGWPTTTTFKATLQQTEPEVSQQDVQTYLDTFANKAMADPITVQVHNQKVSLSTTTVSDILSTTVKDGKLAPVVDETALDEALSDTAGSLVKAPQAAKIIQAADGKRTVVPGSDGYSVVTKGAGAKLLAAITSADRTMTLDTTVVKASPDTTTANSVGTQLMSEFVSKFPTGASNAARTHNIKTALAKMNGVVVQPGEQFSLLKTLMPIDAAAGYVKAPVLSGGVDVLGMGGGISQTSTTLYNAVFFAGMQLDEHKAHSFWISRYPMGREATLSIPSIDNKWTNDSGHPVLIQAGIEGHSAVIRLYGTKAFTVTSTTSAPFNITAPKVQYIATAGCINQPAVNGFDVTVTRVVKNLAGQIVKNERLTTHYQPADQVICTGQTADTSQVPTSTAKGSD
ncbi:putative peptidoglycan binding protein [Branchiibius hedensis]|uniref:Peptidoglycan binding domain-containing protein n=1 Tax=Branchiibius hedensis TaxID=672460 RepID=A0A2Y8ZL97_9MICO|nr:VanW family protein [Branchiibius hedensis]PWJ24293.1 putative peptidoglycan binding protein [Branchiibius hedensis]SSA33110.1 Putative peptidoglycan binding domain-containing protein [Branchiibius hedensis]